MNNKIDKYLSTAEAFIDLGMKSRPPEEHANHFHNFFFNKTLWRWVRRNPDTNQFEAFVSFYPESGRLVFVSGDPKFSYRADPNAVALIEHLAKRYRDISLERMPDRL